MTAVEVYPGMQRDMTIVWEDDGTYRPRCELCGYEGRPQPIRARAAAQVRNHALGVGHRRRLRQRATGVRP